MKLWVDDIRLPPDETWVWARNARDAKNIIHGGFVDEISLDHDAGGGPDFDTVANFIEAMAQCGSIIRMEWHIHSANPVGAAKMKATMESADRYWTKHSERIMELLNIMEQFDD